MRVRGTDELEGGCQWRGGRKKLEFAICEKKDLCLHRWMACVHACMPLSVTIPGSSRDHWITMTTAYDG